MYRRKHGFTLIELMMVMGIIALIISLGVPIYSAMAMSRSLGGSAELINGAFLKYRSKATASGQPIFVVFEHWHMDPELADGNNFDKLTPPKVQAYVVEQNDEAENGLEVLEIDDPIVLPKGTWFHNYWVNEYVDSYTSPTSSNPFADQIEAIAKDYYGMGGNVATTWANKLYMIIFQPDGHLQIIGRQNVAGYEIEDEDPDADIWMTNGDDTILIDVNPSTGRLRTQRFTNSEYDKFNIQD